MSKLIFDQDHKIIRCKPFKIKKIIIMRQCIEVETLRMAHYSNQYNYIQILSSCLSTLNLINQRNVSHFK